MLTFDHLAIAVRDHRSAVATLTSDLGARVLSGGVPPGAGFRAMQLRVGDGDGGMTVEILEPHEPENNDFLARFLDHTGEGPHHITFKTPDLATEIDRLRALGIDPVGINLSDPGWRECFIHPRQGHGTVVQIAESDWEPPPIAEWLESLPAGRRMYDGAAWWDESTVDERPPHAVMERVVVATPDVAAGLAFYGGVLGGEVRGNDVVWNGGSIRLEETDAVARPAVARVDVTGRPGGTVGGCVFRGSG